MFDALTNEARHIKGAGSKKVKQKHTIVPALGRKKKNIDGEFALTRARDDNGKEVHAVKSCRRRLDTLVWRTSVNL